MNTEVADINRHKVWGVHLVASHQYTILYDRYVSFWPTGYLPIYPSFFVLYSLLLELSLSLKLARERERERVCVCIYIYIHSSKPVDTFLLLRETVDDILL